ncbi:MAG: hypothetical protein WCI64_01565 [Chlorobium sp.]
MLPIVQRKWLIVCIGNSENLVSNSGKRALQVANFAIPYRYKAQMELYAIRVA